MILTIKNKWVSSMKYSFIIPVYNGEKYIDLCLFSILNQTYKNFEVIIINDGSTDNSEHILKRKEKQNKKIKLYTTKNKGVSSARNYGIKKSTGDYFIFVDIDDYVDIHMLEIINNELVNNNVDLLKYNYSTNERDNSEDYNHIQLNGKEAFVELVNKKIPFDLNCIYAFNRNFWNKNKFVYETNRYHEDFGLIPYVILSAKEVIIINKILYYYIQSDNSITRNIDYNNLIKRFEDFIYHFDNLYKKVNNDSSIEEKYKILFNSYIANALLLKYKGLRNIDKKVYKAYIYDRNVIKLLLDDTIVRKIKKMLYKIKY